jgi:hypothetical protein
MKVIGITSTYAAAKLTDADAVVGRLTEVRINSDGAQMLSVTIG